ncbi:hypothetical protein BDR04DRAFT_1099333 [Suillus decipiens]|nr:hypothetical protein BDR04DRAFT_1099333 [Suillus decipiens]
MRPRKVVSNLSNVMIPSPLVASAELWRQEVLDLEYTGNSELETDKARSKIYNISVM